MALSDDQVRELATLGAATIIAELEQRLAELRAEFPRAAARARVELHAPTNGAAATPARKKRTLSEATRKKMAAAQRRRHAAAKRAAAAEG